MAPPNSNAWPPVMGTSSSVEANSIEISTYRMRTMVSRDMRVTSSAPVGAPKATTGTAASHMSTTGPVKSFITNRWVKKPASVTDVSSTTVVGVTTRSQTRKPSTSRTNMIVFSPTAARPDSIPPISPATTSAPASPGPNSSISSYRCGAWRRLIHSASARLTRIAVKISRTVAFSTWGAISTLDNTTPTTAAGAPKRSARHSIGT